MLHNHVSEFLIGGSEVASLALDSQPENPPREIRHTSSEARANGVPPPLTSRELPKLQLHHDRCDERQHLVLPTVLTILI